MNPLDNPMLAFLLAFLDAVDAPATAEAIHQGLEAPQAELPTFVAILDAAATAGLVMRTDGPPVTFEITETGRATLKSSPTEANVPAGLAADFDDEFSVPVVDPNPQVDTFLAGLRANGVTASLGHLAEYVVRQWATRRAAKSNNAALLPGLFRAWLAVRALAVSL